MEGKITIGSRHDGDKKYINISVEDRSTGLPILEVAIDMKEFATCITGLAYCKCDVKRVPNAFILDNIGKEKEIASLYVEKPTSYDRDSRKKTIEKSIQDSGRLVDGWMVWQDGTTSQQNGEKHEVILYRYV
jgi:hypothetical protein